MTTDLAGAPSIARRTMKDWPSIIADLQRRMTLRQIAEHCGFASAGAVHSLKSGVQKSCEYERGAALVELHRRLTRRRA